MSKKKKKKKKILNILNFIKKKKKKKKNKKKKKKKKKIYIKKKKKKKKKCKSYDAWYNTKFCTIMSHKSGRKDSNIYVIQKMSFDIFDQINFFLFLFYLNEKLFLSR